MTEKEFKTGDRIKVIAPPWKGREGTVERLDGTMMVVVNLPGTEEYRSLYHLYLYMNEVQAIE